MKQATILLDREPTRSEGDRIAFVFTQEHYNTDDFAWRIEKEIPSTVSVDVADQLLAHRRNLDENACFLVITVGE